MKYPGSFDDFQTLRLIGKTREQQEFDFTVAEFVKYLVEMEVKLQLYKQNNK